MEHLLVQSIELKMYQNIISYIKKRNKVIVVSSAMSGETNKLIKLTKKISKNFDKSEYDAVVATGEQVSCSLIAGRLNIGYFKIMA